LLEPDFETRKRFQVCRLFSTTQELLPRALGVPYEEPG
jgi:hypothetical protein